MGRKKTVNKRNVRWGKVIQCSPTVSFHSEATLFSLAAGPSACFPRLVLEPGRLLSTYKATVCTNLPSSPVVSPPLLRMKLASHRICITKPSPRRRFLIKRIIRTQTRKDGVFHFRWSSPFHHYFPFLLPVISF